MSTPYQKFKSLHASNELFILPNAWDARSAIMFEENNFPAVATSSAAVANSLGYEDGENMSFDDYKFVIRRILSSINVPLTVDIETGYGTTNLEIAENILHLADLGVASINIEDSVIQKSGRALKDAAAFAKTISFMLTTSASTITPGCCFMEILFLIGIDVKKHIKVVYRA